MNITFSTNSYIYTPYFAGKKKATLELEQKITKLNAAGYNDREISEMVEYSYQYTSAIRHRLGLPVQPQPIQAFQIEPLAKSRTKDKDAAETLGISTYWYKHLKAKHKFTKQWLEIDEEEVKQMVLQDKTDREISEHFGGGRLRRIAEIRKSMGKKHRFVAKPTDSNILARIAVLLGEDKPIKEIAADIGKSISWTSILCKKVKNSMK